MDGEADSKKWSRGECFERSKQIAVELQSWFRKISWEPLQSVPERDLFFQNWSTTLMGRKERPVYDRPLSFERKWTKKVENVSKILLLFRFSCPTVWRALNSISLGPKNQMWLVPIIKLCSQISVINRDGIFIKLWRTKGIWQIKDSNSSNTADGAERFSSQTYRRSVSFTIDSGDSCKKDSLLKRGLNIWRTDEVVKSATVKRSTPSVRQSSVRNNDVMDIRTYTYNWFSQL